MMNNPELHGPGVDPGMSGRPVMSGHAEEDDRKIREFAAGFKAVIFAPMIKKMAAEMGPIAGIMEETFSTGFAKALASDGNDPLYLQLRAQLKPTTGTEIAH